MFFDREDIRGNQLGGMLEQGAGVITVIYGDSEDNRTVNASIIDLDIGESDENVEGEERKKVVTVTLVSSRVVTHTPDPQSSLSVQEKRGIVKFSVGDTKYIIRELQKKDTKWLMPGLDTELPVEELVKSVHMTANRAWGSPV
jgi:hypothetical protein